MERSELLAFTPAQVAEKLGLGRTTVYQLLSSGRLPAIRIGRSVRVPASALHDWLSKQASGAAGEAPYGR